MKRIKKYIIGLSWSIFLFLPLLAKASNLAKNYQQLYNPLPQDGLFCPTRACDLLQMFLLITQDILRLIPIASIVFIIIGGFKMIISRGNEQKLAEAKKTVLWAVLGLVVAALSFSIIAVVKNLLRANF